MSRLRSRTREQGAVLFLALFSLSVISFLLTQVTIQVNTLFGLSLIHREGSVFRNAMREQLSLPISPGRVCERQQASRDALSQSWYVCSIGAEPFSTSAPFSLANTHIDYGAVFAVARPCPSPHRPITERTMTTPLSPYTCELAGAVLDRAVVADNILSSDLTVSTSHSNQLIELASPGSITISGTLSIPADTLIIAGGSLTVEHIRSSNGDPLSVTLLSAYGDVTLHRVDSSVSVSVIGRRGVSVPQTSQSTNYPPPPVRAEQISGIIR